MIDQRSEQELTGGGDTLLHYHLSDRATNAGLQNDARVSLVTGAAYAIAPGDDFVVLDTTSGAVTVTLPRARNGKEIEVILQAGTYNGVILPQSGETIMGEADAIFSVVGTAIRFKAINLNWVAI